MRLTLLVLLAAAALPGAALGQVQLDRQVFGRGGGVTSSGSLRLESTFGQPLVGTAEAGNVFADLGYWAILPGTSVSVDHEVMATRFALDANAPNPFASATTIRFSVPRAARVSLKIYDTRGALVRVLADGQFGPGWHAANWNGRDETGHRAPAGVYFSVFSASGARLTRKMVVLN